MSVEICQLSVERTPGTTKNEGYPKKAPFESGRGLHFLKDID
jgi:hypothetical protein